MLFNRPLVACLSVCAFALGNTAHAQPYPSKPIRLIIAQAPGSATDVVSRVVGNKLAEGLGQQLVIDARPGAGGTLGTELAARAAPDGYTLFMANNSTHGSNPALYAKLSYDAVKDFAPVIYVVATPYVLSVHPSLPAKSVKELVALAKLRPGQINYASAGNGSTHHLSGELLKMMAGIDIVHIPYKGAGIAMADVLGGQVPMICTGATALAAHIKSGRLRPIGVATLKRSALMPELPTISEQGLTGFEVDSWSALLAPAKTPEPIIRLLYETVAKIVKTDDMQNFLASVGAEPRLMDPREFGAYLKTDTAKWAKVVKAAKLKLD